MIISRLDGLRMEDAKVLLILGELLTRKGEVGPLTRLWRPVPRKRPPRPGSSSRSQGDKV